MGEIISVIRSELLTLKDCLAKTQALKDAVRDAKDAKNLKDCVKDADNALISLSGVANAKADFLKKHEKRNIKEYIEAQELSEKRDVSLRLLVQVGELEKELANEVYIVNELLKRSSAFIDYRMNVLSGAKADTTYGSPNKNTSDAKKMFDANI